MDLTLGPEETAVRDAIRGVLVERLPLSRVRAVAQAEPGIDEALWREAGGLGWFGLGLPEAEPAQTARLTPERLVDAGLRARERAHACQGETLREHVADRVADRRLLGPERQVHRLTAAAPGPARR